MDLAFRRAACVASSTSSAWSCDEVWRRVRDGIRYKWCGGDGNAMVQLPRAAATSPRISGVKEEEGKEGKEEGMKLVPVRKLRKRAQWSKGDAPGEYGGPPSDLRIRQSWGGNVADPLTSTDDYIWKKEWRNHVEAPPSSEIPRPPSQAREPDSGFLSLNRAITLDSIDVDLSQELMKPSKATLQRQLDEVLRATAAIEEKKSELKPRWRPAPTRREEEKWDRARKAVTGGSAVTSREVKFAKVDRVQAAAMEMDRYRQLKTNLQFLTAGIGGLGAVGAYFTYTPEVTLSYGVGLIGALAYIRMLGNSMDGFGSHDRGRAVRGALGQPRLLIPVALVMIYNRWNQILVLDYGLLHLELIPMLVGFFTYKIATLVETFKEVLPTIQNIDLDS